MHGVIAAGSQPTADAAAEVLRKGGNAADAAVAACFATSVGEPSLTSLAGGGLMMYRTAGGALSLCDFFSDAPKLKPSEVEGLDFQGVDLNFGPITQRFHIGAGSAAVPGVLPGLCEALEHWGTLPLSEVVSPACKMLREGVAFGSYQAHAAALLAPILTHGEKGRAIFAPQGKLIGVGDIFRLPELADTLEAMAKQGWRKYYAEVICPAILEQFGPSSGGLLTAEALEAYRVRFRQPLQLQFRDCTVVTPPAPAAGGPMIALMLRLLDHSEAHHKAVGSRDHIHSLCAAMATADEARLSGDDAPHLTAFERWHTRFAAMESREPLPTALTPGGPGSTTHISVIDAAGNAASVTFSYGEGNGHTIGDTGIMMNNLMGEEDLFPGGFDSAPPGERLPTMMSPSMLIEPDGAITALGSGGANRIRTAIVQVIALLVGHKHSPESAVKAPRIHFEDGVLNAEVFEMGDRGDHLAGLAPRSMVRFDEQNLFFGGVHLAQRDHRGSLSGAGDPRRGGVCITV